MSDGYVKVASLMAKHDELAIFRRFRQLNLQNLLYLQAEITYLEKDLGQIVQDDNKHPERHLHRSDWFSLAQGYEGDDSEDRDQWDKVLQLREKLQEYNTTLAQVVSLSNIPQPRAHDINFLRSWMVRPHLGNNPLTSRDRNSWSADHEDDLLAIRRKPSNDDFTRWILQKCIPFLHRKILKNSKSPLAKESQPNGEQSQPEPTSLEDLEKGHLPREDSLATLATATMTPSSDDFDGSQVWHYEDRRVIKAVNVFSIVVASMLPITSIIILYFVSDTLVRLMISVIFTGLFAFCLAVTTRAARGEIFAATSAFAAVQVVFMTGSNGYIGQ